MIQEFIKRTGPTFLVNYLRRLKGTLRSNEDRNFLADAHRYLDVEQELKLLCKVLPADACCLDVGGNIGYFSHSLCNSCPEGRVVAIEPRPDLFARLQRNMKSHSQFFAHNLALTDQAKTLEITLDPSHGKSTVEPLPEAVGLRRLSVPGKPMDDFLDELGMERLDFIKIDVEGHESSVIQGATRTISNFRPIVLCESENRHLRALGTSVEEVIDSFMKSFDYRCFYLHQEQLHPYNVDLVPREYIPGQFYIYNWFLVPTEKSDAFLANAK